MCFELLQQGAMNARADPQRHSGPNRPLPRKSPAVDRQAFPAWSQSPTACSDIPLTTEISYPAHIRLPLRATTTSFAISITQSAPRQLAARRGDVRRQDSRPEEGKYRHAVSEFRGYNRNGTNQKDYGDRRGDVSVTRVPSARWDGPVNGSGPESSI